MLPFQPDSPQAAAISNLFIVTLIIAAIVFAIVLVLTIVAIIRFRSRPDTEEPRQVFGNKKLEIGWTVAPALLLLGLFIYTAKTMQVSDQPVPADKQGKDMVVIGHQWWWEIRYPQYGVVTANEVHMPVGQKLSALFESADVIHDFWVPQLGRKIDLVPGHPNNLYLQLNTPGTYFGTCAEFCGAQHAWMRIRVIAQTPEDFAAWIKSQQQIPQTPTSGPAAQGAQLFQQIACKSCHTIAGTDAKGTVGPDLTHLASRETLGAGVMDNNQGNLTAWVNDPQKIKPGANMPALGLTNQQLQAIVAYLETLK